MKINNEVRGGLGGVGEREGGVKGGEGIRRTGRGEGLEERIWRRGRRRSGGK